MHSDSHIPYSRKGLEDLATALGVNSAYLWVSPNTHRLDIKQPNQPVPPTKSVVELEEEE